MTTVQFTLGLQVTPNQTRKGLRPNLWPQPRSGPLAATPFGATARSPNAGRRPWRHVTTNLRFPRQSRHFFDSSLDHRGPSSGRAAGVWTTRGPTWLVPPTQIRRKWPAFRPRRMICDITHTSNRIEIHFNLGPRRIHTIYRWINRPGLAGALL